LMLMLLEFLMYRCGSFIYGFSMFDCVELYFARFQHSIYVILYFPALMV